MANKADQWMALAQRLSKNPDVQAQIAEAFFRLTTADPALGRRLLAGDPQAVREAYRIIATNDGVVPMPSGPPRIGASPIGPGETVGGVSGPGVPVNPGTGLIPAPPRGLPNDPSATRQLTTTGGDAPDALDSAAREITVIDAKPTRDSDGFWSDDAETIWRDGVLDEVDEADNVVIEGGPNTDLTVPQYAPASRGPLPPENPFTPAVSTRPRLGHSPAGPGVPVGGPAGGPRGLVPAGPRRPEVPGWVPYAATAGVVGGLGGAIYMGTRPGEASAPGVDADLDAAATDITPDAEMKLANPAGFAPATSDLRRKLPGETLAQYAARVAREMGADTDEALRAAEERAAARNAGYRDALRRQADAEVRVKGSPANYADTGLHTDYRSPYGPMNNFAEGAMATVDGVQVPGFDLGDGRLRYRLGDVKAAQEAERDARWLAGHRAMVEGDIAKYGHYSIPDGSGQLTEQQEKNREARVQAEENQYAQVRRQRKAQIANRNRPLTPYEEEQKARRERVAARAMLAGGSQNINPQNAAAINALVELEGVDPNSMDAQQRNLMYAAPGGQGAAAVDAQSMQNAGNIISRYFNSGSIGGLMNPQAQAAALEERDRAVREQAYNFAVEERNKVHAFNEAPMTRDFALRLKRRVAARFGPRYSDVVDGLPFEGDMASAAPQSVPIDIPGGP